MPRFAAGSGERHPEQSVYNRLADLEWNGPIGEIKACGGVAMIRADSFETVGGFDPSIIAAEDDELCLRMRQRGWKIVRLDAEMARHDIAMYRFRQWRRRSTRTGHAYAEGSAMYGQATDRHFVRETRMRFSGGSPSRSSHWAWPGQPGDQPPPAGRLYHPSTGALAVTMLCNGVGHRLMPVCTRRGSFSPNFPRPWDWPDTGLGDSSASGAPSSSIKTLPASGARQVSERAENSSLGPDHLRISLPMKQAIKSYQVAFLGTGYIADWHAKALSVIPSVSLAAVCDKDLFRAGVSANDTV